MSVKVGQLMRKRMVRNSQGAIVDWTDETIGGVIVQGGRIKNQTAWDAYQKQLADEREAAKAISMQKVDKNAPDRTVNPSKMAEVDGKIAKLEEKISAQDTKLDAILNALKK